MPHPRIIRLPVLAVLWLTVVLPPMRGWFESTMSAHMLLHIPALVLIGWGAGARLDKCCPRMTAALRPFRWALLFGAISTLGIWMIPRLLDLAAESFFVDLVKAVTLTLTGGLSLNLGWRNTGPVARGLIHIEAMASLIRLGWIYAESPARLCTRYGLNDQYWLGNALLVAGGLYAATMAWRALSGTSSTSSFAPR